MPEEKLLGGLLSSGFNESSCLSRYKSFLFRKFSPHNPSSFLLSKLRAYEHLHRRCGPLTESYKKTLEHLVSGNFSIPSGCNYVVWIAYSGLGNRIMTITSAFLYALVTNRVLLIDQQPEMAHLFCEPFPDTSWLLPVDFPFKNDCKNFDQNCVQSYGNMLKYETIASLSNKLLSSNPSYLYIHLADDSDKHDKLFFCDEHQTNFKKIPWLFIRSDRYFVPSLFLIPSFKQRLDMLFFNKETVFHHLGRYLFHPSNQVWGLITRYYQIYMAKAEERIGIQIRVFRTATTPHQAVLDQVWACTMKEKLLPEVDYSKSISTSPAKNMNKAKAVVIASLYHEYFENISNMYWIYPTVSGEVIEVYQPSHEGHQNIENNLHNMKAWAEMNLLSMCDVLVTSAWSTFGYVAQGLAGLKPWILHNIEKRKAPDPPCSRVVSMEPCFHSPPVYDCKAKTRVDSSSLLPHVRHCEDMHQGIKLYNHHE